MALKKCKECGKEISTDAGKCPNCGKSQTKMSTLLIAAILLFVVLIVLPMLNSENKTTPETTPTPPPIESGVKKGKETMPKGWVKIPPSGSDTKGVTDAQIYREFEICMNGASKTIDDNKLEGRAIAASCMLRLKEYGDKRAQKAFNTYFNLD